MVQKLMIRGISSLVLVSLPLAACVRRVAPEPAPDPILGKASFRFVPGDDSSTPSERKTTTRDGTHETRIVPPYPSDENALPEYPTSALAAQFDAAVVGVRIVIDTEGRIVTVADSPRVASSPGPFASDFRAATESAVRSWRFAPAFREVRTGEHRYESHPIACYIDVRFDFQIVRGQGVCVMPLPVLVEESSR